LKRSMYAAATAATFGAVFAPAAAQAQTPGTLVPLTPCIRFVDATVKSFPLQGAGFAPNAAVTIASDGAAIDTVTTDAAGGFQQAVNAPPINGNRANVSITADDGQGHPAGPLALPEVKLGVVWPSNASARKRVLFRAYGFDPGKTVYLHIRRGGKTRGTFKIGRADSPCGLTKRRLRAMPLSRYSTGTYEFWFGATKKFDRSKEIGYRVTIFRRPRAAAASVSAIAATPHWASLPTAAF
jgi:hypothetical protein